MRRQTKQRKRSESILERRRQGRREAVRLLQVTSLSLRKISAAKGISKSVVGELKELLRVKYDDIISNIWRKNGPGRKTVLSEEEERMIVNRLCFAAGRGFTVDHDGIRRIMARVVLDGRRGWRNNLTSDDAVRAFRALHREIASRKAGNKEAEKLKAESRKHFQAFLTVLKNVDRLHPGLFGDPDRIWNVDETAVDATNGNSKKVFCSAASHHGGFAASSGANGPNKHITAMVAVSASGCKTPPFFSYQVSGIWDRGLHY